MSFRLVSARAAHRRCYAFEGDTDPSFSRLLTPNNSRGARPYFRCLRGKPGLRFHPGTFPRSLTPILALALIAAISTGILGEAAEPAGDPGVSTTASGDLSIDLGVPGGPRHGQVISRMGPPFHLAVPRCWHPHVSPLVIHEALTVPTNTSLTSPWLLSLCS